MHDKVNQIAEHAVSSISRRRFLNQLCKTAAATVGVLGGFLALQSEASAGKPTKFQCPEGYRKCRGKGGRCFDCYPKGEPCPVFRCL